MRMFVIILTVTLACSPSVAQVFRRESADFWLPDPTTRRLIRHCIRQGKSHYRIYADGKLSRTECEGSAARMLYERFSLLSKPAQIRTNGKTIKAHAVYISELCSCSMVLSRTGKDPAPITYRCHLRGLRDSGRTFSCGHKLIP
jgi:hypothetical protein